MENGEETLALTDRLVPPLEKGQRAFWFALAFAFLFHAALFIQVGRSVPRTVGDQSGASDAIAVDLVTEADLKSRETVAMPAAGVPQAKAPQPPPPKPEEVKPPEPVPEAKPPPRPEPAPEAKQDPVPDPKSQLPDFESVLKDLATIPQPTDPPKEEPAKEQEQPQPEPKTKTERAEPAPDTETQSQPAKKKAQQQARLEPSPKELDSAPPGRSTSATRPPGITRSGENDECGRAVIRALRQTMPPPRGIFGRVTVRMLLTENGDLGEVLVLAPSGRPGLDQSVVFAAKQTYFPLPPYNATVADRTFTITYIYR